MRRSNLPIPVLLIQSIMWLMSTAASRGQLLGTLPVVPEVVRRSFTPDRNFAFNPIVQNQSYLTQTNECRDPHLGDLARESHAAIHNHTQPFTQCNIRSSYD